MTLLIMIGAYLSFGTALQLYAMAYGTVPVAHATGGLRDTIEDFNPFAKGEKQHHNHMWTDATAELLCPSPLLFVVPCILI